MKRHRVTVVEGQASFAALGAIDVIREDGSTVRIQYDDCIIASGAEAAVPPPFVLGQRIVTFREHIVDEALPESVLVVGGGPIGLEMAYVLREFGSEVTVVELAERILPREEPQVSDFVAAALRASGIEILTAAKVISADEQSDWVRATLASEAAEHVIDVDRVLVATGFVANSGDLGLDAVGVQRRPDGAIVVDDSMRTNVEHVYAIGDVTMRLALAHAAEAQGRVAAQAIMGGDSRLDKDSYREMPRVSYMQPQVASIGLRESEAREQLTNVRAALVPFAHNPMAHARGDLEGFVKLVVHGPHATLAGAHIVGHDTGELLPELALALRWDLGAAEIADAVHAHPTLGETIQDAVRSIIEQNASSE